MLYLNKCSAYKYSDDEEPDAEDLEGQRGSECNFALSKR